MNEEIIRENKESRTHIAGMASASDALSQSDTLRINALDYAWRTASENAARAQRTYSKDEVLQIARDYLNFLQGDKQRAA